MATTVQQAIDMVRSVHPAFSRYMVTDQSLADCFTREQRRLMTEVLKRDRSALSQSMTILLDLANAAADAPGVAGVNTARGVPAESDGNGGYRAAEATTGSALTIDQNATLVSDAPVSAATSTTATLSGQSWTLNAYAGDYAWIVAGVGAGTSPRAIVSNTIGGQIVVSGWEVQPDTTSMIRITTATIAVDPTVGMVTDLPAVTQTRGYLVKLNAQGTPYLDVTAPIIAHVSRGIPLPDFFTVRGGTVRYTGDSADSDYGATPLSLVHEASRYTADGPSAFLRGQQLFLVGSRLAWQSVESIELSYVPVPPSFTARSDYFLLPDHAVTAIAARGAVYAASRIAGLDGVPQPPASLLVSQAKEAEDAFLDTIALTKRARVGRVRPGWS